MDRMTTVSNRSPIAAGSLADQITHSVSTPRSFSAVARSDSSSSPFGRAAHVAKPTLMGGASRADVTP
ncbi:MAG TPA: hypothetical protein DDW61_02705 [Actinobacteria bacterium]|nr:hypothetical protein [Actinomycetota bacterium]